MQTQCSNCAAPMQCGAQEKSCWCQSLPNLPASAFAAKASCLCAACLQNQLNQGVVLYGIPNCDTVKKARAWLTDQGIEHVFWDYKKHGVPRQHLALWFATFGIDKTINQRGTAWRKLTPEQQTLLSSNETAPAALEQHPSVIKRPIVMWGSAYAGACTLGFVPEVWAGLVKIIVD